MLLDDFKKLKEKEQRMQAVLDGEIEPSELTYEELLELDAFLFNQIAECYGVIEFPDDVKH